jgi:hypothetical protein
MSKIRTPKGQNVESIFLIDQNVENEEVDQNVKNQNVKSLKRMLEVKNDF